MTPLHKLLHVALAVSAAQPERYPKPPWEARWRRLHAACVIEHGPQDYEPECPICEAMCEQQAVDAAQPVEPRAFEYLLNAMERAAQEENPAEHGYADKRSAVFAYVRNLESRS